MINNSPFDDHVKKQFSDYTPEVPAHIWENIMAKKEKKRFGGWFVLFNRFNFIWIMLFLLLATVGALIINHVGNRHVKKDNLTIYNSSGVTKKPISIRPDQNDLQESPDHETTENTAVQRIRNNSDSGLYKKENTSSNIVSPAETIRKTNQSKNDIIKKSFSVAEKDDLTMQDNKTTGKRKTILSFKKLFVTKSYIRSNNLHPAGNTFTNQQDDQVIAASRKKAIHSNGRSRLTIESAEPGQKIDDQVSSESASSIMLKKNLTGIMITPVEKQFSIKVSNLNIAAINIPCPALEKNAAANKRYIEIYGGPDYAFRNFSDTANSAYLQKRKQSTSFTSAFSLGIRYTKVFNNAMSFRTGINYSQVNEKFKFEDGHIVHLVSVIDANGDTSGSYATTGTRYKITHNRYRTVDIPLLIGYEMGNGKLHTNINAGFIINAYSWQTGDVLDGSNQPVNITTGKANSPYQFKTNAGLGFMASASFYYRLAGSFHLLAEPYFRYNFSAANKSAITLKQKYTTAGLKIGLRMDF